MAIVVLCGAIMLAMINGSLIRESRNKYPNLKE